MSFGARLVAGHAIDESAHYEEAVRHAVRLVVLVDSATSVGHLAGRWLLGQHHDGARGRYEAALVRPVGMKVDNDQIDGANGLPRRGDRSDHGRKPAAVVPVPV